MVREMAPNQGPHHRFGGAIGGRDRVEIAMAALVLDRERHAEERQDGLARDGGKLVDKGGKIDCRHARSFMSRFRA